MNTSRLNSGFTLVEILVSFALFAIVMTVVTASLTSLADGNRKNQALRSTMDAMNAAMETVSRTISVGYSYDCTASPTRNATADCASGGSTFGFVGSNGDFFIYRFGELSGLGWIERCITAGNSCVASDFVKLTPPEVDVDTVNFYVQGSASGDDTQPHVTIIVTGKTRTGSRYETSFNLETTVTQRLLDI